MSLPHKTRVEDILKEISCEPYFFRIVEIGPHTWAIQCCKERIDIDTGQMGTGRGGKYYVSPHATREEIVQMALGAAIAFSEHETREHFMWRGRQIFGPHMSHEALWLSANKKIIRDPPSECVKETDGKV